MHDESRELAAQRLRLALEMFGVGEALKRQQIRREHPDADEADIEERLVAWLQERPGAESGDASGKPIPWPRPRL
jgi:hypothetical protein